MTDVLEPDSVVFSVGAEVIAAWSTEQNGEDNSCVDETEHEVVDYSVGERVVQLNGMHSPPGGPLPQ